MHLNDKEGWCISCDGWLAKSPIGRKLETTDGPNDARDVARLTVDGGNSRRLDDSIGFELDSSERVIIRFVVNQCCICSPHQYQGSPVTDADFCNDCWFINLPAKTLTTLTSKGPFKQFVTLLALF